MTNDAREQLAKRRFMMLNLARFADLAVVMAGIANCPHCRLISALSC
jgi:hypothetical protein